MVLFPLSTNFAIWTKDIGNLKNNNGEHLEHASHDITSLYLHTDSEFGGGQVK